MTTLAPDEREALEREIEARHAYAELVRVNGPLHFATPKRRGWLVVLLGGGESLTRKRDAVKRVEAEAAECRRIAGQLRTRIDLAEWDAEMATVTPEERLASARAQDVAYRPAQFRRSA